MLLSQEIYHKPDFNLKGLSEKRNAVRAVIVNKDKILMVYSIATDEYKFPGGGIKNNESLEDALIREINEEVGGKVKEIKRHIGTVKEYNQSINEPFSYFQMISDYYEVEIEADLGNQELDQYEKELGFIPKWTTIEEAEKVNIENIKRNNESTTKWIKRETFVLGELKKYFCNVNENCA